MVQEIRVQSQVKSYQRLRKWYLIPPCLTFCIIKVQIKGKWNNPEKGVVPSPTPCCRSYWKGSLWVTLKYSQPTYFTYINNHKTTAQISWSDKQQQLRKENHLTKKLQQMFAKNKKLFSCYSLVSDESCTPLKDFI